MSPSARSRRASRSFGACALILAALSALADVGAPTVEVRLEPARAQSLTETATAYGVLEPDQEHMIAVSIPHAGLITRVSIELGQRVAAGDQLLEISTAPDAVMQFQQAQSAVDFARRETARNERLLSEQLATRAQVDTARRAQQDAESTYAALSAKGMGRFTETIRAPVAGIVARVDVQQGQRVQADSTTLLLASEHHLVARLGVEPEDVERIKPGTVVRVADVFDDRVAFDGRISEVHGMLSAQTRLVDVFVSVPTPGIERLVLGSALSARIVLAEQTGVVVPRSAVLRDDDGAYVFTVEAGTARRINIKPGMAADDMLEIIGPVSAGTLVVVEGNYGLEHGMAVRERRP